jgi:hypothetical protein
MKMEINIFFDVIETTNAKTVISRTWQIPQLLTSPSAERLQ